MNAPTSAPVADDKPLPVKSASEEFPAQIGTILNGPSPPWGAVRNSVGIWCQDLR